MISITNQSPTVPVTLDLSLEGAAALECIAAEKGRTQGEVVERWITAYAAAKERAEREIAEGWKTPSDENSK
jgi:hypothetical protein